MIDVTSLEREEIPFARLFEREEMSAPFFDPNGKTMYAELEGTLYEWDLQKNKHDPEWWIEEE